MEIQVRDKNGKTKTVEVQLTGHENSKDLLNILGLDPAQHSVKAGRRPLDADETVPPHEKIVIEDNPVGKESEVTWNETAGHIQEKIALTIASHFARSPSKVISIEVKPDVTPYQLADTLIKRFGGINPADVAEMVDEKGRNLMEVRYRDRTFGDLGVRAGETLDIQGDITQGT